MPKEELQRGFGLSTSTYVVIASMIGTGILVSPGYMMASLQNYPVIFGLWALGVGGCRLSVRALAGFVLGVVVVGAAVLPYNRQITGNAAVFPLTAYYDEYYGPRTNAFGFGPDRGLGWPIDAFPGHSPLEALLNAALNLFSMNVELLGTSGQGGYVLRHPEPLMEISAAGAGAVLIARRVLEHPDMRFPFRDRFTEDGVRKQGEDVTFIRRARAAGFQAWAAMGYRCSHFKTVDLLLVDTIYQHLIAKAREGKLEQ